MKKYIIICFLLQLSLELLWSQSVSINPSVSSALLIDPLQNTVGLNGTSDDVIIMSDGKVGLGTSSPRGRLDIKGSLRIEDGRQSDGAFLVSDIDGVGAWYSTSFIGRRVVWGAIQTSKNISAVYQDVSSAPISLTGGLWMIVAKVNVEGTLSSTTLTTAEYVWLKIVEEISETDSNKVYNDITESGLPYSIRKGIYQKYYSTPMVQGFISVPVEGLNQKERKYYIYMKSPSSSYHTPQLTSDLGSAYFYAIKLQ